MRCAALIYSCIRQPTYVFTQLSIVFTILMKYTDCRLIIDYCLIIDFCLGIVISGIAGIIVGHPFDTVKVNTVTLLFP